MRLRAALAVPLVAAIGGGAALVAPAAAGANSIYPAGCHKWAYGSMTYPTGGSNTAGDWNGNCWVGESNAYLNYANYVSGVQSLVETNGYGCYPGNIDGSDGPNTNGAVECWQRARGLSADGVVGPATWQSLGYHTLYNPVNMGSYYIYNEFGSGNNFMHSIGTNGYWFTGNCGAYIVNSASFGLDSNTPCSNP